MADRRMEVIPEPYSLYILTFTIYPIHFVFIIGGYVSPCLIKIPCSTATRLCSQRLCQRLQSAARERTTTSSRSLLRQATYLLVP
ncbi:hypothetical protein BOTBODRAFT_412084 [Botryobasidium botryosum FD-172 SS1]|uniref:Uncharacterized protein n=1 Tax=Botryobasidium botryosum (strain FD-172 SS1) TaxID=930990 RepID=A0A067M9V0_BOTB1|nr:hypothetical protein BOTBODRAFT_412084 [Botryobasidium botryosum FD-172 SS1]